MWLYCHHQPRTYLVDVYDQLLESMMDKYQSPILGKKEAIIHIKARIQEHLHYTQYNDIHQICLRGTQYTCGHPFDEEYMCPFVYWEQLALHEM